MGTQVEEVIVLLFGDVTKAEAGGTVVSTGFTLGGRPLGFMRSFIDDVTSTGIDVDEEVVDVVLTDSDTPPVGDTAEGEVIPFNRLRGCFNNTSREIKGRVRRIEAKQ